MLGHTEVTWWEPESLTAVHQLLDKYFETKLIPTDKERTKSVAFKKL
jgi:hypothetical protein